MIFIKISGSPYTEDFIGFIKAYLKVFISLNFVIHGTQDYNL